MSDNQFHARFSMSRLPRIIECPGSVSMEEAIMKERGDVEEPCSEYANKGTYLHSVMEDLLTRDVYKVDKILHEDKRTNAEYVEAIESLLAWVFAQKMEHGENFDEEFIEQKVSLAGFIPDTNNDLLEESEGTMDYTFSVRRTLYVVDWKFGSILVYPDSDQLIGYAAGKLRNLENAKKYDKVVCVIGQPFSGDEVIKTETFTTDEIIRWVKHVLSPALLKTMADPWILSPTEKACQFCKGKARCSARKAKAFQIAQDVFKLHAELPNIISLDELSKTMDDFEFLDQYIRDLASYAFDVLCSGTPIKGYKVVKGRANREWKNPKAAQSVLEENGYEIEDVSEIKFFSPAAVEKIISKEDKKSEWFAELIHKGEDKLSLAKEKDKRPAVNFKTAEQIFEDHVEP